MKILYLKLGCGRAYIAKHPNRITELGFSLVELLIVLVCVTILATPSFYLMRNLQQRERVRSGLLQLARTMEFARSKAMHDGTAYSVCASKDGSVCTATWQHGLLVQNANKQVLFLPHWQMPCAMRYKGRMRNNAIAFTASGFTAASQGRFYCELPQQHRMFSLLLRHNGGVVLD